VTTLVRLILLLGLLPVLGITGAFATEAKNTPGFKAGYSDGCSSANAQDTNYRAEQVRDENLYKTDKHYRSGWASGFYNCRTNLAHPVGTPNSGPIPDNQPGGHPY